MDGSIDTARTDRVDRGDQFAGADTMLVLSAEDVAGLLPYGDCIAAVERAFRLLGEGRAARPATVGVHVPSGAFHIKAGVLESAGAGNPPRLYFAAKVNGNFPGNPENRGLPTIQGVIVLCDAEDGRVLAVMDSMEVTARRTAAATAVAARYLARSSSSVVTVCGCGVQGRAQLRALCEVLPLRVALAFDREPAQAASFAHELADELGLEIRPVNDLASAVLRSDVCVTCTTSSEFILDASTIGDCPGLFLAAVGVDSPSKRELAPEVLASSKIVVDLLEQCARIGDLHHALEAGVMLQSDVHAELSAVVAGQAVGRESEAEVIVFDSTGIALQDVAAAALVYERSSALRSHSPRSAAAS